MLSDSAFALIGFFAACVAVASSGAVFKPDAWYETLAKPSWTPPRWAFPVVWTTLYAMIAAAGWLVWRQVGLAPLPFGLYATQLVLNAAWSALFFGLKRPDIAFAELVLLWLSILGTLLAFAPVDGVAALLFVPYLAWVTAAGALNLSVWRQNRARLGLA